MKVFEIDGYFKDDQTPFSGYLIAEFDYTPDGFNDEEIFFYGLSESTIQNMILNPHSGVLDFSITNYRTVS